MENQIFQIYDRIFKRIFNLSNLSIINLINGLFGTNYPPDSTIEYPNKELIGTFLDKKLADVFLNIQGTTYHLEAQMTNDGSIVFRVFEYGFHYAMNTRTDETILKFPDPIVIYLDTNNVIPETSSLILDFGEQGTFPYTVKNFFYQKHEIRELNQKKLIVLIPFQLLKLKHIISESPSKENFELLQNLICDDILSSIKANMHVGNITADDANQLRELTLQLYDHLYAHYEEIGGYSDMKPLLDGALELPLDKYRIRIDELEQEKVTLTQKNATLESEIKRLQEELQACKKN